MKNKIALACDHAGFELKVYLMNMLNKLGYHTEDMGCFSNDSMDYPDVAHPLAQKVEQKENEYGIAICGSGNGINMTVNKHPGIRSALCWNSEIARLSRLHNDANILALPARFISEKDAEKIVMVFLETNFEGGRHQKRIDKIPIVS